MISSSLITKQYGFGKKFSRDTQLIEPVHGLSQSIQLRSPQRFAHGVRFCIASTVSNISKRIKAVLSHRSQVVSANGNWYQSFPKDVPFGVSQGSTLGPVLFLLFNNAMSTDSQSNLLLFSDDCVDFPLLQKGNENNCYAGYARDSWTSFVSSCYLVFPMAIIL